MDFNWTTVAVMVLNVLFGGVLVAIIKNRVPLRKVETDREANLLSERAEEMAGMRERLAAVEAKLDVKDQQIAAERDKVEAKAAEMEAERTMYRHRIANLSGAFTALLMLLKKGVPVDEAVAEIEAMRSDQLAREVAEAATFRAAGLKLEPIIRAEGK